MWSVVLELSFHSFSIFTLIWVVRSLVLFIQINCNINWQCSYQLLITKGVSSFDNWWYCMHCAHIHLCEFLSVTCITCRLCVWNRDALTWTNLSNHTGQTILQWPKKNHRHKSPCAKKGNIQLTICSPPFDTLQKVICLLQYYRFYIF